MSKFLILLTMCMFTHVHAKSVKELYVAGCGNNFIARIDYSTSKILWSREAPLPEDCNDIEKCKNGILYAYMNGARLINEKGDIIWDYKAPEKCEVYTATKVKNGYMLAMCGNGPRIVMLDKLGKEVECIEFESGVKNIHSQIRQIQKTGNNTFLIPIIGSGKIIEIDRRGELIRELRVGGNPFSVCLSKKKNICWVSCGDGSKIVKVDLNKWQVVNEITNDDLVASGVKMLFVAEVQELKNGNLLVANWNGHSNDKTQPLIFEIQQCGKVVSKLPHNKSIINISAFNIIK